VLVEDRYDYAGGHHVKAEHHADKNFYRYESPLSYPKILFPNGSSTAVKLNQKKVGWIIADKVRG
jgi:hypothetical protein